MLNDPQVVIHGNVAALETRLTSAGQPMVEMQVAANPRRRDRSTGEWSDGVTTWWRVKAWGRLAEHCAETLRKGNRVTVVGTVRGWESPAPDGGPVRRGVEVAADDVAVSLATQVGRFGRPDRSGAGSSGQPASGAADSGHGSDPVPEPRPEPEPAPADAGGDQAPPDPAPEPEPEKTTGRKTSRKTTSRKTTTPEETTDDA